MRDARKKADSCQTWPRFCLGGIPRSQMPCPSRAYSAFSPLGRPLALLPFLVHADVRPPPHALHRHCHWKRPSRGGLSPPIQPVREATGIEAAGFTCSQALTTKAQSAPCSIQPNTQRLDLNHLSQTHFPPCRSPNHVALPEVSPNTHLRKTRHHNVLFTEILHMQIGLPHSLYPRVADILHTQPLALPLNHNTR